MITTTIFGTLIIFIGRILATNSGKPIFKTLSLTLGLIILIGGILMSSVKIIEPGEIGVQKLFGTVQDGVLDNGLHIINPLAEIEIFEAKTQNYTMSKIHSEGQKEGDDAIRVLTKDGLEVIIDMTVLFRVIPNKTPQILKTIGVDYVDNIVRPITRTYIRDNAVYYQAVELYSEKRNEFQTRIIISIDVEFAKRGLQLEQVLIRNISLPPSVQGSIEAKINAEQEAQKMEFVLQKEKQEAERKRVEAQGIADYQKTIASGLTDNQLQYESIKAQKEIATSPNAKVIIMNGRGNSPILIGGGQ